MSIRGTKNGNELLKSRMNEISDSLKNVFKISSNLTHPGIKGDSRSKKIAQELKLNLPGIFDIAYNCNAIDFKGNLSGELDIVIYNKLMNNPLYGNSELNDKNLILPIESILGIIEVKSKINSTEYNNLTESVKKIYKLKPGKEKLIFGDKELNTKGSRIFYTIFSYDTDLTTSGEDWLKNELKRIPNINVDRVIILNKGIINPSKKKGKLFNIEGDGGDIILEWYIHLINFVVRENKRRIPVDWQNYMNTFGRAWIDIN